MKLDPLQQLFKFLDSITATLKKTGVSQIKAYNK